MDSEIDNFFKNFCAHLKEKLEYSFNFVLIQIAQEAVRI